MEPYPGDGRVGVLPVRILCADLLAAVEDLPPGVNLEILSAILLTSPDLVAFSAALEPLLSLAPPTTLALPPART